jgi:hypothetical protein
MHGNDAVSLRPARAAGEAPATSRDVDPDAVYGCVDWYLYHESTPSMRSSPGAQEPSGPAAQSPAISAAGAEPG